MPEIPPRRLITTVYGLYAREEGGWLSVAGLIALLGDLGVDAAAVRSSVSRLKKRAVLLADQRDGRAGYALAPETLEVLREGDRRIFDRPRAAADDGWLVAIFSVPESERDKRHQLRTTLQRLGFGAAGAGVWVAPAPLHDDTVAALTRRGLLEYTEFFRGEYLGKIGPRVEQWWDLDRVAALYRQFVADARALRPRSLAPKQAFAAYVPLLTSWRRLPYLDPGLPLKFLPTDWPGVHAQDVFSELNARLREPAAEHAHAVLSAVGR